MGAEIANRSIETWYIRKAVGVTAGGMLGGCRGLSESVSPSRRGRALGCLRRLVPARFRI